MTGFRVIDFHTHAFPDELAEKALTALHEHSGDYRAHHDGTVKGLLGSMDRAGIERAVVFSIATRPEQVEKIALWSKSINGPRLIPFPSIHPGYRNYPEMLRRIRDWGLKGIKLHPMYQEFTIDDPEIFDLYRAISELGLILIFHAGRDIAFPENTQADPHRILKVHRTFPGLKLVASHLGGWKTWDEVAGTLAGKDIYLETSFSIGEADRGILKKIIDRHSPDRILFGTDSPWLDQSEELKAWKDLDIPAILKEKIFFSNAERLLGN